MSCGRSRFALQETRRQNVVLGDSGPKSRFGRQFPHTETSPYVRNAAISRDFERDPIPYALDSDWLVDDAVSCEPVSAPNSLLTGKLTGNFAKSGLSVAISCPINARIQRLTAEFPTQQNREFSNAYQGISFGE
jgi:hypothetical protein